MTFYLFLCLIHFTNMNSIYLVSSDIRVEQADFGEISVTASGENGPTVSIVSYRSGSKVIWHHLCVFVTF